MTKKNGIEVCKIGSKELGQMYTDQEGWLNQQIIDAYLLYLVAQDINHYPVSFCMKYVPTSFFEILHMDVPENAFYSDKMHHLF